jgi:predicted RNA-binding Zn-ribbon protein involved in translation (DUF1610 family)
MAISFSCAQCGRNLKAPDSAAGRSSKCPGCGSTVTCPDAVYDAELLEETPATAEAYGVLDADQPYAMTAEPVEAAAPSGEVRRACPVCGEMIVATAAKCRFCGEVFDDQLVKGGKKGKLKSIASAQRNLVTCIFFQFITFIVFMVLKAIVDRNQDPLLTLILVCDVVALIVVVIGGIICTFLLAPKVYSTGTGVLLGLLTFVPYLGWLILVIVNQRATATLRDNGYEVGLFGAKTS